MSRRESAGVWIPSAEIPMKSRVDKSRGWLNLLGWINVGVLFLILVGVSIPPVKKSLWVGQIRVQAAYTVVDAETGRPLIGATVHFRISEEGEGFCSEETGEDFENPLVRTTDSAGKAVKTWKVCMCYGSEVAGESTIATRLPSMWFQVSAPGYATSAWSYLDDRQYHVRVRYQPRLATLEILVQLHKS